MDLKLLESAKLGQQLRAGHLRQQPDLLKRALDPSSRAELEQISANYPTIDSVLEKLIRYNHQATSFPFRLTLSYQEADFLEEFKSKIALNLIEKYKQADDSFHKLRLLQGLATVYFEGNYNGGNLDSIEKDKVAFIAENLAEIKDAARGEMGDRLTFHGPKEGTILINHRLKEFKDLIKDNALVAFKHILDLEADSREKLSFIEKNFLTNPFQALLLKCTTDYVQAGTKPVEPEVEDEYNELEELQSIDDDELYEQKREKYIQVIYDYIVRTNNSNEEEFDIKRLGDKFVFMVELMSKVTDLKSLKPLFQNRYLAVDGLENQIRDLYTASIFEKMSTNPLEQLKTLSQKEWNDALLEIIQFLDLKNDRDSALATKVKNDREFYFSLLFLTVIYSNNKAMVDFQSAVDAKHLMTAKIFMDFVQRTRVLS